MSIRRSLVGLAVLAASATFLAPTCIAGQIVYAGDGGSFSYGWGPLNEDTTPWTEDAYINNLVHYVYQPGNWYGFVHPGTKYEGSVTWHFQTDAGAPFTDDVTVSLNWNNFDSSYGFSGLWSTNGSDYYEFFHDYYDGHDSGTFSLSDTGYAGGQDLYITINASNRAGFSGYIDQVQLFRQSSPTRYTADQTFVVSGTQVPEPSTLVGLAGLFGMGLIGSRWRRRKAA